MLRIQPVTDDPGLYLIIETEPRRADERIRGYATTKPLSEDAPGRATIENLTLVHISGNSSYDGRGNRISGSKFSELPENLSDGKELTLFTTNSQMGMPTERKDFLMYVQKALEVADVGFFKEENAEISARLQLK